MSPGRVIFGKVPFLKYTTAFGLGILLALNLELRPAFITYAVIGLFLAHLLLRILFQKAERIGHFNSLLIAITLVVLGLAHASNYRHARFKSTLPHQAQFTGYILEKSPSTNNRYRYLVNLTSAKDSTKRITINEKIILYNADTVMNPILQPGQQIYFHSQLNQISNSNNPGEFNYQRYMLLEGIRYQAFVKKGIVTITGEKRSLKIRALQIQSKLLEKYLNSGIAGDEFAVLAALSLGNKDYLSNELKSSFASSGSMHVLAVSGLHVGIIYLVLLFLLKPLDKFRRFKSLKIFLIITMLWAYAFITGLSPSVLRSATMFSLILIGDNLHRKTNIYNTLAFSAFVLMLFDPTIIFKTGFQLSYAAVTSIVFFQPKIAGLIRTQNKILKWVWELFAVSLAAQIGTLPLSLYYFHQFPVYFWLSNFVAIPAASILLYLAFIFFLTAPIPLLSLFFASLLRWTVKGLNHSTKLIENLPGSVIHHIWMDKVTMYLLIAFILTFSWVILNKKHRLLFATLLVLFALITYSTMNTIKQQKQSVLIFYNHYTGPLLSIIDGDKHYYYTDSSPLNDRSVSILKNASTYFGVGNPINISTPEFINPNLNQIKDYILYKYLTIIKSDGHLETRLKKNEILWETNISKITLNQSSNLQLYTLKKGKPINIKELNKEMSFNTQNNSSLMVYIASN